MITKKILQSERDLLQGLNVEVDARKSVITDFLKAGVNTTTSAFKTYEELFFKAFKDFQQAKSDIEEKYVRGELTDNMTADWEVNYDRCEITITLK